MPPHSCPSFVPDDWLQYSYSPISDFILLCVNSATAATPCWESCVFDIKHYRTSKRHVREVHVIDAVTRETHTWSLSKWLSDCKPALKGNLRAVLYYESKQGWQRLPGLLDDLIEVGAPFLDLDEQFSLLRHSTFSLPAPTL